jgi:hypothetical protein
MRLLIRYAVKNQYMASAAACAFAPKLATQTLINNGAVRCQSRPRSEHHVDQRQQRDY